MPEPETRKRRIRWQTVVLTLLAVLLLLIAYGWHLHRSEPEMRQAVDRVIEGMTEEELTSLAQSIESLVVNESQGIDSTKGPSATVDPNEITERRVVIPIKDANIWLATRLNQLLANQNAKMPRWLRQPRVWIDDGELVLSGRLNTSNLKGVVSVYLAGEMLEDGQLRLQATGAKSGRLPIPTGMIESLLRDKVRESGDADIKQLGELFSGIVVDPEMRSWSDKQRKIRLLDFEVFEDRLELLIRTSPTKPAAQPAE